MRQAEAAKSILHLSPSIFSQRYTKDANAAESSKTFQSPLQIQQYYQVKQINFKKIKKDQTQNLK